MRVNAFFGLFSGCDTCGLVDIFSAVDNFSVDGVQYTSC